MAQCYNDDNHIACGVQFLKHHFECFLNVRRNYNYVLSTKYCKKVVIMTIKDIIGFVKQFMEVIKKFCYIYFFPNIPNRHDSLTSGYKELKFVTASESRALKRKFTSK